MAAYKIVSEVTLKSVGIGLRVGTYNRPLTVAIGVATDKIKDLRCEILARNPQCGKADKIMQYRKGMNDEIRVGTAARPPTVVTGVTTSEMRESHCPDLQEASQCADADKSVQEEESVQLDFGVGNINCPTKVARGVHPLRREKCIVEPWQRPPSVGALP